ncbi:MAG: DNA photolyase [Planctomycetota bacterium]|nr:DNA photolyase [Planctomycetota bacterium]MDA1137562.1 DNA photolyase [Planctomycetota bacterium]
MVHTIYIEEAISEHPRVQDICDRFPKAVRIPCGRYGEVFNRRSQNFRLQKQWPALILANKHDHFVLGTPEGYGIGSSRNYYFSHMLNCPYDCRYCFLQGMYQSAHYVLFVNYEDFQFEVDRIVNIENDTCFFTGYDCDSLAFESVTSFTADFLPLFQKNSAALFELRTKSVNLKPLLAHPPLPNVIVAYSLTPARIGEQYEDKAPPLRRRIEAIKQLQDYGWPVGLRFDPIIFNSGYREDYTRLYEEVFSVVDVQQLHSASMGPFRLPKAVHETVVKLYPKEKLFAAAAYSHGGMISYQEEIESDMLKFCEAELLKRIPADKYFPCRYG